MIIDRAPVYLRKKRELRTHIDTNAVCRDYNLHKETPIVKLAMALRTSTSLTVTVRRDWDRDTVDNSLEILGTDAQWRLLVAIVNSVCKIDNRDSLILTRETVNEGKMVYYVFILDVPEHQDTPTTIERFLREVMYLLPKRFAN